jgi:NADP-dependent 3-hydroxy acid dehydrogenase YdfG
MKSHFHGKLDAVILCHGIVVERGIIGCNVPDFDQTMLINVRSMTHIISLAMPFLKIQNTSSVTVLTSSQGLSPDPMSTVMSISAAMV